MRPGSGVCSFPRPIGRGSIEAFIRHTGQELPDMFPRPIGRGSIEAGAFSADGSVHHLVSTSNRTWLQLKLRAGSTGLFIARKRRVPTQLNMFPTCLGMIRLSFLYPE